MRLLTPHGYNARSMRIPRLLPTTTALFLLGALSASWASSPASWTGVLHDEARNPVLNATLRLHSTTFDRDYSAQTSATGTFAFHDIPAGTYELSVTSAQKNCKAATPILMKDGAALTASLQLCSSNAPLHLIVADGSSSQSGGGEHLSSEQVSSLPLNARDFSKLLLLAAGTMTDANGAANFTQC